MDLVANKLHLLVQGNEKSRTLSLKYMTLCEPVITTRQSTRHGHRNKIITNSQNMYICENSPFFTVSNPL